MKYKNSFIILTSLISLSISCSDEGDRKEIRSTGDYQQQLNTELMDAVNASNPQRVIQALQDGADVNYMDKKWGYPLTRAYEIYLQHIAHPVGNSTARQVLNIVLHKKPLFNIEFNGINPLIVALENDLVWDVSYMLEFGADVNAHTTQGKTPLKSALMVDNWKFLEILIHKGARVNETSATYDNSLLTLMLNKITSDALNNVELHASIPMGRAYSIEALLNAGAHIDLKNTSGISIYERSQKDPLIPESIKKIFRDHHEVRTGVRQAAQQARSQKPEWAEPAGLVADYLVGPEFRKEKIVEEPEYTPYPVERTGIATKLPATLPGS